MLTTAFISGSTLHISFTDMRLVSLTVYSGHPDINIHDITDADLDALINALIREELKRQVKAAESK